MYCIKLDDNITLSDLLKIEYFTCKVSANGENLLLYLVLDEEYDILTNIKPDLNEIYLMNNSIGAIDGHYNELVLYVADADYFIVDSLMNMFQDKNLRACVMQIK